MFNRRKSVLIFFSLMTYATAGFAQGEISGYMFGDVYYVARNHRSDIEGENGFWFRRIYFTYDHAISGEFSTRFRVEMNSPGDFETKAKLEPFVKDAYLKWTKSNHAIILGMSPTPMWGYLEKFWGFRAVEKTPADLLKFSSSRDLGVAVKGELGQSKKTHYHFMLSNGSGTRSETNQGKKVALALGQQIAQRVTVEVYADFEERPGATNRVTAQGVLTYEGEKFRIGVQLVHQIRQREGGDDLKLRVGSIFAVAHLSEKFDGFVRFDRAFNPLSDGPGISYLPVAGSAKFNFLLFGIDYQPHKQVHFMPNVEMVFYNSTNGSSPDSDIIPRLTFFYSWK